MQGRTWDNVCVLQISVVQELIREIGLAPTKAKNICNMSKVQWLLLCSCAQRHRWELFLPCVQVVLYVTVHLHT